MTGEYPGRGQKASQQSSSTATSQRHHHRSTLKQKNKPFKGESNKSESSKSKGKTIKKPSHANIAKMKNLSKMDRKNKANQHRNHIKTLSNQLAHSKMTKNVLLIPITPNISNNHQFHIEGSVRLFHYQMEDIEQILLISLVSDLVIFVANVDYKDYLCDKSRLLFSILRARGFSGTALLLLVKEDDCHHDHHFDSNTTSIVVDNHNDNDNDRSHYNHNTNQKSNTTISVKDRSTWHEAINAQIPLKKTITDITDITKYKMMTMVMDSTTTTTNKRGVTIGGGHVPSCMTSRSWLLSDSYEYNPNNDPQSLSVYGYLRGRAPLSANQLIYIPKVGTCSIERIESTSMDGEGLIQTRDDIELSDQENDDDYDDNDMDFDYSDNENDNNDQDDIDDNSNDDNDIRQKTTCPSLTSNNNNNNNNERENDPASLGKRIVKVPKGTSSYQAAWMVEDDTENESEMENDHQMETASRHSKCATDTVTATNTNTNTINSFKDDPMEIEKEDELEFRMENETRKYFPDEVQVPEGQTARQRFHKYRGVQSMRTSKWQSVSDIPKEYSQIIKFDNIKQTINRSLKQSYKSPFKIGDRVKIVMKKVLMDDIDEENDNDQESNHDNKDSTFDLLPSSTFAMNSSNINNDNGNGDGSSSSSSMLLLLIGLSKHEDKYSVINFTLKNNTSDMEIISKQEYIAIVGFRTFVVKPTFSEYTNDQSSLSRYLKSVPPSCTCVGSFYGPVTMAHSSPVLLFVKNDHNVDVNDGSTSDNDNNLPLMVGTGSLLYPNPDRCILKRITLCGHSFKIHARVVVARFMFDNPEDVTWFKPIELVTNKTGRRGHIIESLGTHGYMKCIFDGNVKSGERMAMHLYKRVFPKWSIVCL